jgi:hypothetical protein
VHAGLNLEAKVGELRSRSGEPFAGAGRHCDRLRSYRRKSVCHGEALVTAAQLRNIAPQTQSTPLEHLHGRAQRCS